jgi:hypothetical protein
MRYTVGTWTCLCAVLTFGCDKPPETARPSAESPAAVSTPAPTYKPAAPGTGPPRWTAEKTVYEFGEVWAGETVDHPFKISNEGGETLLILHARPRCSCTVSENYPREIPPGGSGTIPFKMNTTGKKGPVDEYITVKTNDPVRPDMNLHARGVVKTVVDAEVTSDSLAQKSPKPAEELAKIKTAAGAFGMIHHDDRLERTIRLRNATGRPLALRLAGVHPPASPFKATLQETAPGEEFQLSVVGEPPFPVGQTSATAILETSVPDRPYYNVGLFAYVPDRIEVMPPERIVIDPQYPYVRERKILITNYGKSKLDLTSVSTSEPRYKLEVLPPKSAEEPTWLVKVLLPDAPYSPPSYGELIRIETTDAQKKVIDISVLPSLDEPATPRPEDKPLQLNPIPLPPG